MSPRRPVLLLVFAAALIGAGVWLALGDAAHWGVPGDSHPVIAPPPGTSGPPPAAPPAAVPEVLVEIVPTARLLQLAPRPLPTGAAGCRWVAGPAAVPSRQPLGPGPQLLRIDDPAGPVYRVVHVGADGAVELGPRPAGCAFVGRVVDEAGVPIAGARAWLGGRTAVSDADGSFRFDGVSGGNGVPLVLRAAGRASAFHVVTVEPAPASLVYVLEPGAAVEVQFAGRLPAGAPARVLVLPGTALESRAQRFPFFLQGDGAPEDAGVALDALGRCRLAGLPLDTELSLVVRHPLLAAVPVTVRLRREIQRATVTGTPLAELAGVVVGGAGAALRDVTVRCRPHPAPAAPGFGAQWLLPPDAYALDAAVAISAADGRFRVGRREGRDGSLLELVAPGHFGLQVTATGEVAERTFSLPREAAASGPPELHLIADRPARLRLREGDHTTPSVLWSGEDHAVSWHEPVLVDVLVTVVPSAGGAPKRTTHRNVVVWGSVELSVGIDP